jgi:CubicO group peptidase (beta-lactamase class C family)
LGLSIGIHSSGKTYTYDFGTTERGKQSLPTSRTQYCIGSITKTFTGVLLAQAAVEKKLTLEDDVRKWLPGEYPNLEYEGQPLRLWQLINHTSGLPFNLPETLAAPVPGQRNSAEHFGKEAAFLEDYTNDDFLRDLHGVKLSRLPGEKFSYSNAAAQAVGVVLERVYDQSYEDLVRAKIAGPLAMDDTKVELSAAELARFPRGYSASVPFVPPCSSLLPAHGSLKSTTADMLKYVAWHLAETDEAVRLSHQPAGTTVWTADNSYTVGLNWQILQSAGRRKVFQGGSVPGHQSLCVLQMDTGVEIIVLTNEEVRSTPVDLSAFVDRILEDLDPLAPSAP